MRCQIDLRRKLFSPEAGIVVVPQQFRSVNHLIDELVEGSLNVLERLTPIVSEGKDRHRLVRLPAEIMPKFLHEFRIHDRKRPDRP